MSKQSESGEIIQYVRAYSVPVGVQTPKFSARKRELAASQTQEQETMREIKRIEGAWGGWCLVPDTETTIDTRQALRFGFYEVHGVRRDEHVHLYQQGRLTREVLDARAQAGVFPTFRSLAQEGFGIFDREVPGI